LSIAARFRNSIWVSSRGSPEFQITSVRDKVRVTSGPKGSQRRVAGTSILGMGVQARGRFVLVVHEYGLAANEPNATDDLGRDP
jgi:hypothetical protein